ncbi:hypothetical protein J6590_034047 [Homalodisca vitripennis]|nr:hypothetical protein J6590_034047 [Homalodisca vitripennis]
MPGWYSDGRMIYRVTRRPRRASLLPGTFAINKIHTLMSHLCEMSHFRTDPLGELIPSGNLKSITIWKSPGEQISRGMADNRIEIPFDLRQVGITYVKDALLVPRYSIGRNTDPCGTPHLWGLW